MSSRPRRSRRRGVGEALERERRALQVRSPVVIGKAPAGQPAAPVVRGHLQPVEGVRQIAWPVQAPGPTERDEPPLTLGQRVARSRTVALDPDSQIRRQLDGRRPIGRVRRAPAGLYDAPPRRSRAVIEHRLAHDLDLHLALDALDYAHEQMVGVEVGRRARVTGGVGARVVPRPDRQRILHDDPARWGHPRRLEHHRPRHVAHRQRHHDPVGADPEASGASVEQRPEHAR